MRVLVTGGNGFVGINVINEIINTTDWEIVCFVNKNAERLPKHIKQINSFDLLTSDSCDSFDVIIHAGGNPSSKSCILNPTDAFQSNIDFTFRILEYARCTNVKKIIFFSSCEVYGFATDTSCETDMLKSYNMYGASKVACEHMCSAYYHTYGISTVAIRLLNTYGPYCQEERFPSIIQKKFTTEENPHFILTNKTSKRWLDIREMARRTVFIIKHMPVGFETFNFVGDENLNLVEIIEKLSNLQKFTYEYIETPKISGYHHEGNADGSKYKMFEQSLVK
jgi:dTDP-glucose 4,6-dehydratase